MTVAEDLYFLGSALPAHVAEALDPDHPDASAAIAAGFAAATGDGEHAVYRLLDERNRTLFVGLTSRGARRVVEKWRKRPWFDKTATATVERYETRSAAARRARMVAAATTPIFRP